MLKGCGAVQFRGHTWCDKCGACWGLGDDDAAGSCLVEVVEYVTFYAPITLLAVVAAALVHPGLAFIVFVGLGVFSLVDLYQRAAR